MSITTINWTRAKLKDFKHAYQQAVDRNESYFSWQGHDFVTGYAYYLIEFLESQPLPP